MTICGHLLIVVVFHLMNRVFLGGLLLQVLDHVRLWGSNYSN